PERTEAFIQTFLRQYQDGGQLPMWELAGNYTGCMIGYHAVPVIYDAFHKGLRDFDHQLALKAMVAAANADELGKPYYREWGFLGAEIEPESVSKTLEYAYNDWCIAQMAKDLGKTGIYQKFMRRAQSYKNLLHPEEGFMVSKTAHRWCDPFDPTEVNFHYTEANSWQYSLYVPQDVEGLIKYLGGPAALEKYLDDLFSSSSETSGREQADITGLIGQYAHGNEPSHHMAYLYNYIGKPWKTQARVHEIMSELYQAQPDGLPGNEDCGQMSSWYVFSAMGLYPVCPGSSNYILGKPMVGEAMLPLPNGDTLRILSDAPNKRYVKEVYWNGAPYPYSYIRHEQLMEGGTLEFKMVNRPVTEWAVKPEHQPKSSIQEHLMVPVPGIVQGGRAFFGADTIQLNHLYPEAKIYYTLDGRKPDSTSTLYTQPIPIRETTSMKAIAWHSKLGYSKVIEASFRKVPNDRTITLNTEYSNQYAAGGDRALIDYLQGGNDFRTGEWQGYHAVNLDAVVDLGKRTEVKEVNVRFLQDHNSWIFMPERVQFFESKNGQDYNLLITMPTRTDEQTEGSIVEAFSIPVGLKTRYIKIVGQNRGVCPPWHKGAGGKAWVFADEIEIITP
ncbi:MAG: GH92 family glycosyl hydrolase, partial [Bacteroidota bacterium]